MVVKNCEILPVEVIVRGYITGSAWRDYQAGRPISGITLAPGLRQSQKLPQPILTPSTKAEIGKHDEPISEKEIITTGLVTKKLWEQVREVALALFSQVSRELATRGLIMVDTKYEFGLVNGKLVLADEVHTLDSSRYWIAASYPERFEKGESPEMLDKEPTRQWLLSQGYSGEGQVPVFTDEHRVQIARHYVDSFGKILGREFSGAVGPVAQRIEKNLQRYLEGAPLDRAVSA
jgi:phosphoribosylaminoimidazole-succinocarboxamide synthase